MLLGLLPVALAEPDMFAGCDDTDRRWIDAHNDAAEALDLGDLQRGVKAARKAVAAQPGCHASLQALGEALFRLADPEAFQVALDGARRYPDASAYPTLASRMAFGVQNFPAALEWGQKAYALAPADTFVLEHLVLVNLRLGDYDGATALLDAATEHPATLVACLRVEVAADRRDLAAADAALAVCEAHPDAGTVARVRAFRYSAAGDLDRVEEAAGAAGDTDLGELAAAFKLLAAKRYAEAEPALKQRLEREPWNAAVRACYAASLVGLGRRAAARKELDQLFDAEAWVTIDRQGGMSGITTKGAEKSLEATLQSSLVLLVNLLIDQGELDDAVVALRKAEARFGRIPRMLALEVRLAQAQSGPAAAWPIAAQAVRSWPREEVVLDAAARVGFADPTLLEPDTIDILLAGGGVATLHNTIAALGNGGRPECARAVRLALPRVDAAERDWARTTAFNCALRQKDLAEARAVAATGALPSSARAWFAGLLWDAGQTDEAIVIAKALVTDTEGDANAVRVLANASHSTSDVDGELRWGRHPNASPTVRLNAAISAYNAKRDADAAELWRMLTCADLGPDQQLCGEVGAALARGR